MNNQHTSIGDPDQPTVCQIRIKGHLGRQWSGWFDGMTITLLDNGDTLITGAVVDQAALHGLLKKVRDFGMRLISVNCTEPGQAQASVRLPAEVKPPAAQPDAAHRKATGSNENQPISFNKGNHNELH